MRYYTLVAMRALVWGAAALSWPIALMVGNAVF